MSSKHNQEKWAQIVAKAWTDESFKRKLLSNPKKVLEEHGLSNHSATVKIIESSNDTTYYVLPRKPSGQLSERQLKDIAAAGGMYSC